MMVDGQCGGQADRMKHHQQQHHHHHHPHHRHLTSPAAIERDQLYQTTERAIVYRCKRE